MPATTISDLDAVEFVEAAVPAAGFCAGGTPATTAQAMFFS